ncbi:hypothetical protein [Wolbachia endosymbiont (group A) of Bibio marci]|uniref:hypothetical protein n=1 Tax=Wolbachia endosymbiont (group A) of Bibio marci TaxID=2953987 RepID=UPI00222E3C32|nr:hypothetical protein [Wolbachia endosymbiont (group A) of Bibio marci]
MTKKGNGSSSLYIFILLLCHTYKDLISTYKKGNGSSSLYIFILLLCHTYKDLISTYKKGSFKNIRF